MRLPKVMLVLVLAACHPQGSGEEPGALAARAAVEAFLAAAKAQDIRAMSNVFGHEDGLVRDGESQREHEMRMLSLMCFFNHERASILSETPGETRRFLVVELVRDRLRREVTFTAVVGPRRRWYVSGAPVNNLQEFRRSPSRPPGAPAPRGTP